MGDYLRAEVCFCLVYDWITTDEVEGMDRVRLWSIEGGVQIRTPEQGFVLRGPPSCMVWAKCKDDARNVLVFGTAKGQLVFWRESQEVNYFGKSESLQAFAYCCLETS